MARLLALFAFLLAGCTSVDPQSYRSETPAFELQRYFDGTVEGHGMVLDRGGRVQRRFVVKIQANWNGDVGTLDEDFVWSDGERERRIWSLRRVGSEGGTTRWTGTAAGVVGEAQGVASGNALAWSYAFDLPTASGRTFRVDFEDWMFLIDERVMLNRALISYYGIRVGEVLISFRKR
jgi:hypothetical protein